MHFDFFFLSQALANLPSLENGTSPSPSPSVSPPAGPRSLKKSNNTSTAKTISRLGIGVVNNWPADGRTGCYVYTCTKSI